MVAEDGVVVAVEIVVVVAVGKTVADVREGVAAFLEKRSPSFPGRITSDMPPGYPWWGR